MEKKNDRERKNEDSPMSLRECDARQALNPFWEEMKNLRGKQVGDRFALALHRFAVALSLAHPLSWSASWHVADKRSHATSAD